MGETVDVGDCSEPVGDAGAEDEGGLAGREEDMGGVDVGVDSGVVVDVVPASGADVVVVVVTAAVVEGAADVGDGAEVEGVDESVVSSDIEREGSERRGLDSSQRCAFERE